jgi:hypothetical protein
MEEKMAPKKKSGIFAVMVILFTLSFCFIIAPNSQAATTVYFEGEGLPGIAAFQFDILSPIDLDASLSFDATLPGDWLNMTSSGSNTFNSFSLGSDLPTGPVGSFDIDVELGNWVLGDQNSVKLIEDTDYIVGLNGSDYTVKAVPIPSALLLLGGGLLGLLGIRRRVKN